MFEHNTFYIIYKSNLSYGIEYKKVKGKYKYELGSTYEFTTGIKLKNPIIEMYYEMNRHGRVITCPSYRWNGANWCPDTKKVLIPSLGHDILTQMYRDGYLLDEHIPIFNDLFAQHCKECNMPTWQYKFYRQILRGYWRE